MPLRALMVLLLLAGAGGAALAADAYRVTGVASGEVLYMREAPNPQGAITGAIPPGARGVLIEKAQPDGWGHVVYRGRKGWAALRYLSADPPHTPGFPEILVCSGTEPFWSVRVDGAAATYADPDGNVPMQAQPAAAAKNRTDVWQVTLSGGPIDTVIVVDDGQCSDGMSDTIYPYTAYARSVRGLLAGCCRAG